MSDTDSSNITKAPKADSALAALLKELSNGKVKVNESDKKAVSNTFKKAMAERAKLQAALDKFDAESDALAVQMIRCYGATQVVVEGVRYVPTSRGPRVYYKKMSDSPDVVEL